ncbi:MAG: UDP-N-acetyl-D-mannosaminuronic acid transferase [Elusimicrobia bacterium]|nr:UDP-N-acetyl-D-mannosaminuronic acid transferase [Elusimicrobiota bacterium]
MIPLTAPSTSSSAPYLFEKNVYLLGCPTACLNLEETVEEVNKMILDRRPHQHCVINAGKMVLMHRDPVLKNIVHSCSLINADGQSVVWALKLLGRPIPERVTGIDLMERLFVEADKKKYRVFFLGAVQWVLDTVLEHVKNKYPGVHIAGAHNGYFLEHDNARIVSEIARSNADILFVAMGSPKKEYWLNQNLSQLGVPFCMGVGGSFDVIAGRAKRAPRWIQNIGMEWFYRYIQEPIRLWRRYWVDNFIFVYLVLSDFFKIRIRLKHQSSTELAQKEIT